MKDGTLQIASIKDRCAPAEWQAKPWSLAVPTIHIDTVRRAAS